MCMLLYRLARPIYLKNLYLKAHRTPSPCVSRVGFCHGERHRVGAGAVWCGVGALVAARRASCRVGPSIPHGRPQGPHTQSPRLRPRIHATPAPPRGGISAPQKPTPESLVGVRLAHLRSVQKKETHPDTAWILFSYLPPAATPKIIRNAPAPLWKRPTRYAASEDKREAHQEDQSEGNDQHKRHDHQGDHYSQNQRTKNGKKDK